MGALTARTIGAGGLATPGARWALMFAWSMGGVKAVIDGQFTPAYLTLPMACALCLVVVILLTSGEDLPLGRPLASLATALVIVATGLAFAVTPPEEVSIWQLHFVSYLLALLFVRGNPVFAGIGAAIHFAMVTAWVLVNSMPIAVFTQIMMSPLVAYAASVIWVLTLHRIVAQEQGHRSEAAEYARQIRAEHEAAERIVSELELVRSKTERVLARLRDGATLDDEFRTQIAVIEGEVRDRIRSPRLQHPEVNLAIAAARARGASVNVLAEDSPGAPQLGERAASEIAAILRDEEGADSLVIAWTEPERVSVVARKGDRSERYLVEIDRIATE